MVIRVLAVPWSSTSGLRLRVQSLKKDVGEQLRVGLGCQRV